MPLPPPYSSRSGQPPGGHDFPAAATECPVQGSTGAAAIVPSARLTDRLRLSRRELASVRNRSRPCGRSAARISPSRRLADTSPTCVANGCNMPSARLTEGLRLSRRDRALLASCEAGCAGDRPRTPKPNARPAPHPGSPPVRKARHEPPYGRRGPIPGAERCRMVANRRL
jgi:hypothetical protein